MLEFIVVIYQKYIMGKDSFFSSSDFNFDMSCMNSDSSSSDDHKKSHKDKYVKHGTHKTDKKHNKHDSCDDHKGIAISKYSCDGSDSSGDSHCDSPCHSSSDSCSSDSTLNITVRCCDDKSSGCSKKYKCGDVTSSLPSSAMSCGGWKKCDSYSDSCSSSDYCDSSSGCGGGYCGPRYGDCGPCGDSCAPCGPCDPRYGRGYYGDSCDKTYEFKALVTPLKCLKSLQTGCCDCVTFIMRRKNRVVTMQWEPFTGVLGCNGVKYLVVNQAICNLPPWPVDLPIRVETACKSRISFMRIDPSDCEQIKIYLHPDCDCFDMDDCVTVPGGCVSWITC